MSDPTAEPEERAAVARARRRADWAQALAGLAASGGLRQRPVIDSPCGRVIDLRAAGGRRRLVNWASNDYLGRVRALSGRNAATRALRRWGTGAGAARLLAGGLALHRRLEERLASWLDYEDCLLTTTGYQANLAALTSLAEDRDDVLVLDRLCHASSYDGARLATGRLYRFAHNDAVDLARVLSRLAGARRRIVAVESVYSMDGDEAPLAEIRAVCDAHDALLVVDEAHALGVFGPGGRGCCAAAGVRPDLVVATCSKSLASQGGIICGDRELIAWIVNRARSFIFSTAPVPAAVAAALASLDWLRRDPQAGERLLERTAVLRQELQAQGWQLLPGRSPILPILVGEQRQVLDLAQELRERGHFCPPIRPPVVPTGACRLRLTLTLGHRDADLRRLCRALAEVGPRQGMSGCSREGR